MTIGSSRIKVQLQSLALFKPAQIAKHHQIRAFAQVFFWLDAQRPTTLNKQYI